MRGRFLPAAVLIVALIVLNVFSALRERRATAQAAEAEQFLGSRLRACEAELDRRR